MKSMQKIARKSRTSQICKRKKELVFFDLLTNVRVDHDDSIGPDVLGSGLQKTSELWIRHYEENYVYQGLKQAKIIEFEIGI